MEQRNENTPQVVEPCAICQEKDIDFITGCGHHFHHSCLKTWYETGRSSGTTCPVCRNDLNRKHPCMVELASEDVFSSDEESEDEDHVGWGGSLLTRLRGRIEDLEVKLSLTDSRLARTQRYADDFRHLARTFASSSNKAIKMLQNCERTMMAGEDRDAPAPVKRRRKKFKFIKRSKKI